MTHSYTVSGMTCQNCVAKVKSELLKIREVTEANVQLSPPHATISMQTHVPVSTLEQAVRKAGNFHITPVEETASQHQAFNAQGSDEGSGWKAYWPLVLVFSYIMGISIITSFNTAGFHWMDWMNNFMGGFFIAFSFFKLLDLKGFAESYATYDLLASKQSLYGRVYPFIELGLGVAYIVGWEPVVTNVATILVMGFSSIGVIRSVMQKRTIKCACLGTVFNLPMSTVTIVEDVLMVVMAAIMLMYLI